MDRKHKVKFIIQSDYYTRKAGIAIFMWQHEDKCVRLSVSLLASTLERIRLAREMRQLFLEQFGF